MINSISSQHQVAPLQLTPKAAKTSGAASATTAADLPINEKSDPPSEELKESSTQKSAEALRALGSQEAAKSQSLSAKNILNPKSVAKAYQPV